MRDYDMTKMRSSFFTSPNMPAVRREALNKLARQRAAQRRKRAAARKRKAA